ncbi:MAG: translocation/assembly module TamB domain-containing protein [Candidatus Sulfobium sp.]
MKRKIIYGLSAGLVLAIVFLSGAVFWVLGTSAGARWLIGEVSSHTSLAIQAGKVDGKIWGDLRLGSVAVQWSGGRLHAESFHVSWSPLRLLYGSLAAREVVLRKVYLRDDRPEEAGPSGIVWPHVTGLLSRISIDIDVFSVEGLIYRRLEKNAVSLNSLSGGITWRKGVLTVRDLKARSPLGKTEGTIRAGFITPSLFTDLAVMLTKPAAGLDMISVGAELHAGHVSGPLGGNIRLTGNSGKIQRIELRSGLELDRHAVRLVDFRVTRITGSGSVTGSGEVTFSEGAPRFHVAVRTTGLDLSPFIRSRTDLSAAVVLQGTVAEYQGQIELSNEGNNLRSVHLHAALYGNEKGMGMTSLEGSWLGGAISGTVRAGWEKNVFLRATLQIRDINPSLISPAWTGQINGDASATALLVGGRPLTASFSARLLKSSLRGKALTGEVKAGLLGSDLRIERLLLRGEGFDVAARGELLKRIDFLADISDLSGLVPGARGALHTAGWVRWHDRLLSGNIEGRGRRIEAGGLHIGAADFSAHIAESKGYPVRIRAACKKLDFGRIRIESADLSADGTLTDHVIELEVRSQGATIVAKLSGGYEGGKWQGKISNLSDKDASGVLRLYEPSTLLISGKMFSLSRLVMKGAAREHFEAGGELTFAPLKGSLDAEWADMGLDRASYWLTGVDVAGKSSGNIRARWLRDALHQMSAHAEASGAFVIDDQKIRVDHASVQLDRDEHTLLASFDVRTDKGTMVKGNFSSSARGGVFLPEEGTIDADLRGLNLSLFRRWLPEGLLAEGIISASLKGKLLPGMRFDIAGDAAVSRGVISRRSGKGEVSASLRTAEVKFAWHDRRLAGKVSLVLKDYGHADGSFNIPMAASLPPTMEGNGPIDFSLNGQFLENGLLAALFPGLVQETQGRIDLGIKVGGTWKAPDFRGTMHLYDAGAYFPSGGIHIKDAGMSAHLDGDRVVIDSFRISSGPGKMEGTAEIRFKDRDVLSYKGTLKGKDFQAIYLPELRMQASPDLTFEGSNKKLSVRGEIKIPYLLVLQSKTKTPVEPSRDVVIIGREEKGSREMKTVLDIEVTIILGDRVLVKAEGIDARLGGSLDMAVRGIHDIRGKGQVHVVKGKYSTYGVSLDIVRGRVIFAGQPITQPNLDILALRTSGDVKAGVTVTGTPGNPVVKLYSDPAMSDTDIVSYIVLGHPLGGGQQQADLVARAAGFLLSASDSVVFQDQLKQRLGIDTLDIESTKTGQESVSRSLVTVGKYLTPGLYISYGRSLLGDTNLFRVRYSLSKHWELETQSGTESGADLFYKIDLK